MKRSLLFLAALFAFAGSAIAGTRVLTFIYQPLTNLGTEEDAAVEVTRVPVLINAVPEAIIAAIAWPNRILQEENTNVPDSNFVSLLKIKVTVDFADGDIYHILFDLSEMLPSEDTYGVKETEVVAAAAKCLRSLFVESKFGAYELKIKAKPGDKTDWKKFESRYQPKKKGK